MRSEKVIREKLERLEEELKTEIEERNWNEVGSTATIITWLKWVLKEKYT